MHHTMHVLDASASGLASAEILVLYLEVNLWFPLPALQRRHNIASVQWLYMYTPENKHLKTSYRRSWAAWERLVVGPILR